jgi:hypothetical protein
MSDKLEGLDIDLNQIIKMIDEKKNLIGNTSSHLNICNYRAASNWLKQARKNTNNEFSDLKKSNCCVEAIYHLLQIQDFVTGIQVLKVNIDIPNSNSPIMPLHEYLLYQGEGGKLLKTMEIIYEIIDTNKYEVHFLSITRAKAAESLGQRSLAAQIYENICKNEPLESNNHIEALAHLANCRIQMGQYQIGVPILKNTLKLVDDMNKDGADYFWSNIKYDLIEQLAFYRMNSGSFDEAFNLFGEVFRYRRSKGLYTKLVSPLGHQGIILRKSAISKKQLIIILLVNLSCLLMPIKITNLLYEKFYQPLKTSINQNYQKAEDLLRQAYKLCDDTGNENAKSWIAHHLSWVLLNSNQSYLAEEQALIAIKQYKINGDQRGQADCHEQLGRIYLTKNNLNLRKSEFHLNQSLDLRKSIDNFNLHGVASSTLSLSFLYWHQKKYLKSLYFMVKSARAYQRINMLSIARILAIITLFSVWTVGDRDWTA